MKRILLLLGLLGAFGATAAVAQTRVSVSIGFGVPAPYVTYYPRSYRHPYIVYYPRPPLVVIRRPAYRPVRVIIVRPHGHGRRHRYYHGYR
ncbi:MAG TPA: hypothetical protein VEK86_10450 [Gemmatimonadales bacterium]|nr:hypothetical protein [Gemmatimonadales bacterium]